MGEFWKNKYVAVFLLITAVVVQSLPTSVLVESKHNVPGASTAGETGNTESVEKAPKKDNADGLKPKLAPQKRGVNQNIYGRDLSNDIAVNNNIPRGVWDDDDASVLYPELQDYEDYNSYSSYRPKPYDNLQNILNSNAYDEPEALPARYPYARFIDDRKKRSAPGHALRLKRNLANKKPVDMVSLLAMLEAKERERARLNTDSDYSRLYEYPTLPHLYNNDDDLVDDQGEWLNGYVEPGVQAYENPYRQFDTSSPYSRSRVDYPPKHRFIVSKKKRSLSAREIRNAMSDSQISDSRKPYYVSGFDSRYNPSKHF